MDTISAKKYLVSLIFLGIQLLIVGKVVLAQAPAPPVWNFDPTRPTTTIDVAPTTSGCTVDHSAKTIRCANQNPRIDIILVCNSGTGNCRTITFDGVPYNTSASNQASINLSIAPPEGGRVYEFYSTNSLNNVEDPRQRYTIYRIAPPPVITCSVSPKEIEVGSPAFWQSRLVSGGKAPINFSWSGTDGLSSSVAVPPPKTYITPGRKFGNVIVSDSTTPPQTTACADFVDVYSGPVLNTIWPYCQAENQSKLKLSWTAPQNYAVNHYSIERGNNAFDPNPVKVANGIAAGVTSSVIDSPNLTTGYYYRVVAHKSAAESPKIVSNWVGPRTGFDCAAPEKPSVSLNDRTCLAEARPQLKVSWVAGGPHVNDSYLLDSRCGNWVNLAGNANPATYSSSGYCNSNLASFSDYTFQARTRRLNIPLEDGTTSGVFTSFSDSDGNATNGDQALSVKTLWCDFTSPSGFLTAFYPVCYDKKRWGDTGRKLLVSASDGLSGVRSVSLELKNTIPVPTAAPKYYSAADSNNDGLWETVDIPFSDLLPGNENYREYELGVQVQDNNDRVGNPVSVSVPNPNYFPTPAGTYRAETSGKFYVQASCDEPYLRTRAGSVHTNQDIDVPIDPGRVNASPIPSGGIGTVGICQESIAGPPPAFTCSVDRTQARVGDSVTWKVGENITGAGGPGTYTFSWKEFATSSASLGTNQTLLQSYSSFGTKRAGVTVTSCGKSTTKECGSVNVTTTGTPLLATCQADVTSALTNITPVAWRATVSGGTGRYTYRFSGSDNFSVTSNELTTNVFSTSKIYYTEGVKIAQIQVSDGEQTVTANCNNVVNVIKPSTIKLYAAGSSCTYPGTSAPAYPPVHLYLKGTKVQTFPAVAGNVYTSQFVELKYSQVEKINAKDVYVTFDDCYRPGIEDANVRLNKIVVDGVEYSGDYNPTTYSTYTVGPTSGCAAGYGRSDLMCGGGMYFDQRGLVGYWEFEEGSGTSARDSSGNNNHGTLVNNPVWTSGKYGKALDFSINSSQYVEVNNPSGLATMKSGTLSAWVYKKNNYISFQAPVSIVNLSRTNGWNAFDLDIYANSGRFYSHLCTTVYCGGVVYETISSSVVGLNSWVHLATTFENGSHKLYVNGNLVATGNQGGDLRFPTGENVVIRIGRNWGEFFDGAVDRVRIYNYVRTREQIIEEMNTP